MKTLITLLLTVGVVAGADLGDFAAWYFEFHKQPVVIEGQYTRADGTIVGILNATVDNHQSADGRRFIQTATFQFQPAGTTQRTTVEATVEWRRLAEGVFQGAYRDSNETTATHELTLEEGRRFTVVSTRRDRAEVRWTGRLADDDKIHTTETLRDPGGKTVMVIKQVYSRQATADLNEHVDTRQTEQE